MSEKQMRCIYCNEMISIKDIVQFLFSFYNRKTNHLYKRTIYFHEECFYKDISRKLLNELNDSDLFDMQKGKVNAKIEISGVGLGRKILELKED